MTGRMTGRISEVLDNESDGSLKTDPGDGDTGTNDRFSCPGDDSPPLPGDDVALVEGSRSGSENAVGYSDQSLDGIASPGEKRCYSRTSAGALAASIWLKGDGTIVVQSELAAAGGVIEIAPSGVVTVNGAATIDTSGEVIGKSDVPATQVGLTTHQTASPMGPLAIIPGT